MQGSVTLRTCFMHTQGQLDWDKIHAGVPNSCCYGFTSCDMKTSKGVLQLVL